MADFERNKRDELGTDGELGTSEEKQDYQNLIEETQQNLEKYLPNEKSDGRVLDEAGVDVEVDDTYDMATRQGREGLAKDLHHRMQDVFHTIAENSDEPRTRKVVENPKYALNPDEEPKNIVVDDPLVDQMEEEVYNHLAQLGASRREIGEDEVYEAVASVITKYHSDIDRMEEGYVEEFLDSIDRDDLEYKDLDI